MGKVIEDKVDLLVFVIIFVATLMAAIALQERGIIIRQRAQIAARDTMLHRAWEREMQMMCQHEDDSLMEICL